MNQQENDPVKKQPSLKSEDMNEGLSPMSPPEAFLPPSDEKIDFSDLHPFLQELSTDHVTVLEKLRDFKKENSLLQAHHEIEEKTLKKLGLFLEYLHVEIIPHNRKEEYQLFRVLNQKLISIGEHSAGVKLFTGIQILEDDHVNIISFGGALMHLLKLMRSIEDKDSKNIIKNEFIILSNELVELLELHIFREDNIIFGQAQILIPQEQLDLIANDF